MDYRSHIDNIGKVGRNAARRNDSSDDFIRNYLSPPRFLFVPILVNIVQTLHKNRTEENIVRAYLLVEVFKHVNNMRYVRYLKISLASVVRLDCHNWPVLVKYVNQVSQSKFENVEKS